MAQFAVLNWERRRVSGLVAEGQAGSLQIQSAFSCEWPDQFDPFKSPVQAAEQLRKSLPAGAALPPRVIVSLSREDVILRHLEVPDVPEAELPDLVRFQAAARSTVSLDQLLLDFLPLEKHAGSAGRPVLVVTAAKQFVQGIQAVLQGVNVTPAAITFSSLGLAECVCHCHRAESSAGERTLLGIVRDGSQVELVIVADGKPLFAHAARLPGDDQSSVAALLSETSRAIVAAQRQQPHLKIDHAYFTEGTGRTVGATAQLAERLGVPVSPLRSSELPGLASAAEVDRLHLPAKPMLIGLALAETQRLSPGFDFLHPRQPPAQVNRRKLQLAAGAAAALLIVAVSASAVEMTRSSLQSRLEELQREESELDVKIKPGQASLQAAKLVDQWQTGNLNQLQQLSSLEQLMEGTGRMYLSQYSFAAGTGDSPGSLQATGNARSRDDVLQFQQRLVDTKSFSVQPRQLTQVSRDEDYPSLFELNANLLPKTATKPATAAATPTPNRQPTTPTR